MISSYRNLIADPRRDCVVRMSMHTQQARSPLFYSISRKWTWARHWKTSHACQQSRPTRKTWKLPVPACASNYRLESGPAV